MRWPGRATSRAPSIMSPPGPCAARPSLRLPGMLAPGRAARPIAASEPGLPRTSPGTGMNSARLAMLIVGAALILLALGVLYYQTDLRGTVPEGVALAVLI